MAKAVEHNEQEVWRRWVGIAERFLLNGWLPLVVLVALAAGSAAQKSATFDEPVFLASGGYYLRTGDTRFNAENPPLIKAIYALPTLLWGEGKFSKVPSSVFYSYSMGEGFRQANEMVFNCPQFRLLIFLCRLMPILVTCALGYLLYRLVCPLWGARVGRIVLWGLALSPNMMAHARLTTADMATAFLFLACAGATHQFLKKQSLRTSLILGGSIGALLLSKFTGVLILCVYLVQVLGFYAFRRPAVSGRTVALWSLPAFLVALLMLNTAYSFRGTGASLDSLELRSSMMGKIASIPLVSDIPMPLPKGYIKGFDIVAYHNEQGLPNIFLGEYYPEGETWWHYYVVAVLLKTPLPFLFILGAGAVLCVRMRRRLDWSLLWVYGVPAAVLFLNFSVLAYRQLGIRYILPVWPFFFIMAAAVLYRFRNVWRERRLALSAAAGLAWYLAGSVCIFPHYLSYFNTLAGGPDDGWQYLAASNIDWGQDLPALKRWQKAHDYPRMYVLYYGTAPLKAYGVERVPWGEKPLPRYIAVSVTNYYLYRDVPLIQYLRREKEPLAYAGRSIHIYEMPQNLAEVQRMTQ